METREHCRDRGMFKREARIHQSAQVKAAADTAGLRLERKAKGARPEETAEKSANEASGAKALLTGLHLRRGSKPRPSNPAIFLQPAEAVSAATKSSPMHGKL